MRIARSVSPSSEDQQWLRKQAGSAVVAKRLEQGTFAWPKNIEEGRVKLKLAPEAFAMLTDGIDLRGANMRPWYEGE